MVSPTQLWWRYHSLPLSQRLEVWPYIWYPEVIVLFIITQILSSHVNWYDGVLLFVHHLISLTFNPSHDDVIKWKHFPRYWAFVRGIHWSTVNSRHKGQWCGALMFSLICAWTNTWINTWDAGDLRRHHTHYGITLMWCFCNPAWPRLQWLRLSYNNSGTFYLMENFVTSVVSHWNCFNSLSHWEIWQ